MPKNIFQMLSDRRNRELLYSTPSYWNSKADAYHGTSVSMWPNRTLNELYQAEQELFIERFLPGLAGQELIDIGCGTGRMSRWFANRVMRVVGVDFAEGPLRIATRDYCPSNLSYRQCSVFNINYNAEFDIAFTWSVLTFLKDSNELRDALRKVHQALRPGGNLLLLEPVHSGFLHRVLDMPISDFIEVIGTAGFEVQAAEPMHFWPMRLILAYIDWPPLITTPLYNLGQAAMKLPGLTKLGDYWAIKALSIPN